MKLKTAIQGLLSLVSLFLHIRRVNRLRDIASRTPTTEKGIVEKMRAIQELKQLQEDGK